MSKYLWVRQAEDRKNKGQMITVAYIGNKIGFSYDNIDGYTGLFCADRIDDREKCFKFSGSKISCSLPAFSDFYKYCTDNHIEIDSPIYHYLDSIIIFTDTERKEHFITFTDKIVPVEPFNWSYFDRRGNRRHIYGINSLSGYSQAYTIMRQPNICLDTDHVMQYMVGQIHNKTHHFRYYTNFNMIAMYDEPWSGEKKPLLANVALLDKTGSHNVSYSMGIGRSVEHILKEEDKAGRYIDYSCDDVKSYMRQHFIGNAFYGARPELIAYNDIECAGQKIRVYFFNRDMYNLTNITDEDRKIASESKEEFERFRKYLAKNLGSRSFMTVAGTVTTDVALRLGELPRT